MAPATARSGPGWILSRSALVLSALVLVTVGAGAQQLVPAGLTLSTGALARSEATDSSAVRAPREITVQTRPARASWWSPLASLIVPGSGQLLLGQQRSVAYAVAEVFLITQTLAAQRDVSNGIRDYQRLAVDAARKPFGGPFPAGPWRYYEALEFYDASGAFDRTPGGAIDPETDARTYNGDMWQLARNTFWNDPDVAPPVTGVEYQRALAFYTARAFRDEFAWSWTGALQQGIYVQAVATTNRSNQRKTNIVTLVGVNHLASLIDAYITVRLRRYGGAGLAGLKVDGIDTRVGVVGDPADGRHSLRSGIRLVPAARAGRSTR